MLNFNIRENQEIDTRKLVGVVPVLDEENFAELFMATLGCYYADVFDNKNDRRRFHLPSNYLNAIYSVLSNEDVYDLGIVNLVDYAEFCMNKEQFFRKLNNAFKTCFLMRKGYQFDGNEIVPSGIYFGMDKSELFDIISLYDEETQNEMAMFVAITLTYCNRLNRTEENPSRNR